MYWGNDMRILFIGPEDFGWFDYLSANVLHGLSELSDVELFTYVNYWFMYEGNKEEDLSKLYGRGYSYTNCIKKDNIQIIEETKISEMIESHFFDIIIYSSLWRCLKFLDIVKRVYDKASVFFIDGEDYDNQPRIFHLGKLDPRLSIRTNKIERELCEHGTVFKRELALNDSKYYFPISFAIPKKFIIDSIPEKTRDMAFVYPGRKETYIYKTMDSYYQGYRESKFGTTFKKGGWDCMRHYEILANGCIPYFPGIEKCPRTTMVSFPKNMVYESNILYDKNKFTDGLYNEFLSFYLDFTKRYLTTEALAKYLLSFCN